MRARWKAEMVCWGNSETDGSMDMDIDGQEEPSGQCPYYNTSRLMEEGEERSEAVLKAEWAPEPQMLLCPLCTDTLRRPTTLACGHTFCHQCLMGAVSRKQAENSEKRALAMIPLCPRCLSIIWRPLAALRENVALAGLVARFGSKTRETSAPLPTPHQAEAQFHILIDCASIQHTPLPHCNSTVVFATAFIDEIIEQQAQANLVVLRWPGAQEGMAIAGRLIRPQTYHQNIRALRFETVYKAVFEGRCFVRVTDWQQVDLKVTSVAHYNGSEAPTSPLALCQTEQVQARNPVGLEQMGAFFEVYDKLNNPVYLRQIGQLVDEKVLHERAAPEKLIYCVMRLLRLEEKEVRELAALMDDHQRWLRIEEFLLTNTHLAPVEVIRIDTPGNYPHALVFALLLLVIVFHYMAK